MVPIRLRPFGPSQPSAPTIQTIEKMSPVSVNNISEKVRVKTRSSKAISTSARPDQRPHTRLRGLRVFILDDHRGQAADA